MESMHEDPVTYYKELEAEINKRIHASTNCRSFTLAFGQALEAHLKRARIHKRLTTRWLNRLELPNKDEIAAIAVRMVDYQEKLDLLDETIYTINQRQRKNQSQLRLLRKSTKILLAFLENEIRVIQDDKLKTLEKELTELKQLFQTEFNREEINND
ncbi:hypothetical protein [Neobacillus sp.]|uniref:hypothetical protein n=1 Tax=Neobacillus sp. TaxID=2675273 RepID=UPI00289E8715|nr:hypothetical protein [Neobacillus sp.]